MSAVVVRGFNGMTAGRAQRGWSASSGTTKTVEYKGPSAKAAELFAELQGSQEIDEVTERYDGATGYITVTYYDDTDDTGGNNDEENADWGISFQSAFRDLATHPYFGQSGVMPAEIADVDELIKRAEAFDSEDFTFGTELNRYYGLRICGVKGYNEPVIVLTKKLRKSRRTIADALADIWTNVERVVSLASINPPAEIIGDISKIPRPTTTLGQWTARSWEWIERPPTIAVTSKGYYDITCQWLGAAKWSKVLYGGSWDPTGDDLDGDAGGT